MENKLLATLIMDIMNKGYANFDNDRTAFDDSVKAMEAYDTIRDFIKKYFPDNYISLLAEIYSK